MESWGKKIIQRNQMRLTFYSRHKQKTANYRVKKNLDRNGDITPLNRRRSLSSADSQKSIKKTV